MTTDIERLTEFEGYTFTGIEVDEPMDQIWWFRSDGKILLMHHQQDCCEDVEIVEITGDMEDLIGTPIVIAEEVVMEPENPYYGESLTFTTYNFRTIKGSVTIQWKGESNGYYSEEVDIDEKTHSYIPGPPEVKRYGVII